MDEEELAIKLDTAIGMANAVICIQTALATALHLKGIVSAEELATLPAVAKELLQASEITVGERTMAESTLRGISQAWSSVVTRN